MDDQLLLLGILQQSEMHGYQLYDFIEKNLSTCTNLKKSSAYFLLNKMEREGLVKVSEQRVGNRPPRKVFELSEAGRRLFGQLLEDNLAQYTPTVFAGDIGLAFLDQVAPQKAGLLLQKRLQKMQAHLAELEALPPHPGSASLLIKHQIVHLRQEIRWLETILEQLTQETLSTTEGNDGVG